MTAWTPRHYQEQAIAFTMQRAGAGLMLDPGLGKTSITLACIDILRSQGEIRKTLIVAPLRVCYTVWPVEATKWDDFHGLKIVNLHGMKAVERATLIARDYHVYLINPESLEKVLPLLTPEFDLLVLDESTKFKDTQTLRFKALRKHLFNFKRRMILTGTPVPNGLQDLFGQMFVVDFGESLGKYVTHFRTNFCRPDPSGFGWVLNRGAPELIYKRVAKNLMRMDARDHIDMPELINNFIPVELPRKLRPQYDAMEKAFVAEIENNKIAAIQPSAAGTKLRQMANGFIYDDQQGAVERRAYRLHTEKLDALQELVEEMQGRPLLVAYEFQEDALMIAERFDGVDLPYAIDLGKVKNPNHYIAEFNAGRLPLVIGHPAGVGHGLNLQEACHDVCFYGITWNLEHHDQFIARVNRQGQRSPYVSVHYIGCKDTKDADVMAALTDKGRTQKSFNDAIKSHRA